MIMIKNILFDIDGTLFPTNEFAELARRKAIRAMIRMGLKANEEELYKRLIQIIRKKGPNYSKHFDVLCRSLNAKSSSKFVAAAVAAYHDTKMSIQPYPEVPNMLLALRDSGYSLYVATNGDSVKQWDKLIRLGIALYFNDVFVSSDLKEEKGVRFYKKILKRLKADAAECFMVGDREDADIIPAKEIGMRTIRVRKGKYSEGATVADFEVSELGKITDIMKRLKTH